MAWDFARELATWGPESPRARARGLSHAHAYCKHVTTTHYENFSVASLMLPRRLLRHFHAVYAYCRWSDDLADETTGGAEALDLIAWWRTELLACYEEAAVGREPRHPVMIALRETIRRFDIPPRPFLALLIAFEQDQKVKRYDTFDRLSSYCNCSANPVGHLVLMMFACFDAERALLSNEVCTGLQLANFWQDVARDFAIGRVYVPQEDLRRFGVGEADIAAGKGTPQFRELIRFEVERTKGYFDRGEALLPLLPREARVNVELFLRGGRAILRAIERQDYDVLTRRPVVTKFEKVKLMLRALAGRLW